MKEAGIVKLFENFVKGNRLTDMEWDFLIEGGYIIVKLDARRMQDGSVARDKRNYQLSDKGKNAFN